MRDIFEIPASRLAFPSLFEPSFGPVPARERGTTTPKFRTGALITEAVAKTLPEWITYKEAAWRNAPEGMFVTNLTTNFRVPVFGLPKGWLNDVRNLNLDPDRVLAMCGAAVEVIVAASWSNSGDGYSNFADLIAVNFTEAPMIPTLGFLRGHAGRSQ